MEKGVWWILDCNWAELWRNWHYLLKTTVTHEDVSAVNILGYDVL